MFPNLYLLMSEKNMIYLTYLYVHINCHVHNGLTQRILNSVPVRKLVTLPFFVECKLTTENDQTYTPNYINRKSFLFMFLIKYFLF